MKNNNLSNRSAMCILVRVEDFLVNYKDSTVWDKFVNIFMSKESRATLNDEVLSLLWMIFRNTDMTVDLVIDKKNYSKIIEEVHLAELPYGRLIQIDKPVQISTKLNIGEYAYYIDNNPERMSLVGNKRAISLEQINIYLKGGYRFE